MFGKISKNLLIVKIVNVNVTEFDRKTTYLYQKNITILDFILSAGWKSTEMQAEATTEVSTSTMADSMEAS